MPEWVTRSLAAVLIWWVTIYCWRAILKAMESGTIRVVGRPCLKESQPYRFWIQFVVWLVCAGMMTTVAVGSVYLVIAELSRQG